VIRVDVDAVVERISAYLDRRMGELLAPGVQIALTDSDGTLAMVCHGFANAEARTPVESHHRFQIGSISKGFTVMALLQEREAGNLDLGAPVTEYLPWLEIASPYAPITVHHLLSHTAGLILGTEFTGEATHALWSLHQLEPGYAPGERFWYSNDGYKALGLILERITGRPWFDVVGERVMSVAGMEDAPPTITHNIRPSLAVGYGAPFDDRPWQPAHGLAPAVWSESGTADGTISATADELAGYVRLLLNRGEGVIKDESFELMSRSFAPDVDTPGDVYGYGLKWVDERFLGHSGSTIGYVALALCEPQTGFGVAICANGMGPRIDLARFALATLAAAAAGDTPPVVPERPAEASVPDAERYDGEFRGVYPGERSSFEVRADGDRLLLVGDREAQLAPFDSPDSGLFLVDDRELDRFVFRFTGTSDGGRPTVLDHGPDRYVRDGGVPGAPVVTDVEPYVGHYRTHDPWQANIRVFVRDGALWLQDNSSDEARYHERPLEPFGNGFRVGESWSPDRIWFDSVIDGRATRAVYDGASMYRMFTP
jgi:D-alanyl-D-alanine carboxypeptidase